MTHQFKLSSGAILLECDREEFIYLTTKDIKQIIKLFSLRTNQKINDYINIL